MAGGEDTGNHPGRRVSREQLGALMPQGAFSVRAFGSDAGRLASNGYIVGTAGHGHDIPGTATVDDAEHFIGTRRTALEPADRYFGLYQGQEPPRASMDVSRLHPATFSGHVAAATEAASTNQESYGRLREPTDYTDIPNPSYDPEGGHSLRSVSMAQMGHIVEHSGRLHPGEGVDQPVPSRTSELSQPSRVT